MDLNDIIATLDCGGTDPWKKEIDFLREVRAAIWELPEWNSDKYTHHCVCMCERCHLLRQGIAKLRTLAGGVDA